MTKIILVAAFIFFILENTFSQENKFRDSLERVELRDSLKVRLTDFEKDAEFIGGDSKWLDYLKASVNSDIPIRNKAPHGKYSVVVTFDIYYTGKVKNVLAETSYGYGMEEEAIRVIKNSPRWTPAHQNYRYVISRRRQAITFIVPR